MMCKPAHESLLCSETGNIQSAQQNCTPCYLRLEACSVALCNTRVVTTCINRQIPHCQLRLKLLMPLPRSPGDAAVMVTDCSGCNQSESTAQAQTSPAERCTGITRVQHNPSRHTVTLWQLSPSQAGAIGHSKVCAHACRPIKGM